ncbi:SbcC/MukB-like Walker B domain-containing protein [Vibrio palustris]|uniref:Nuclease SbcCD subunit C n=1 Tax=Vibrio palustris TaxID=1918946 RepID=A0A1R4B4U0_9VIBR|nr:SMC family ATPase [Vibrio palustris]SJL83926.1 Nuclease SbcCD subunit C [Vibrio palustris]
MRPISLTLQAFGPFADQQTIEFDRFGAAPLFLINGATGAGKSSILDAICYALYGETTGSERTGDQMRCDYADPNLLTFVRFAFALGDKQYEVERYPEQQVPKKRGEGFTRKTHSATLIRRVEEEQTLLANKPTPVRKAVEELLGLEVNQFRQVMVIPQGKFRELLIANSKDREAIFGQLFQTHIYTQIERALFERAAGIRKEKDEFDNQIKGALNVAALENEGELDNAIAELTPRLAQSQEAYKTSQQRRDNAKQALLDAQQLVKQFNQLATLKQALHQLNTQQTSIDAKRQQIKNAEQAAQLDVAYSQYKDAQTQTVHSQQQQTNAQQAVNDATQALTQAQTEYDEVQAQQTALPTLTQEHYDLQSMENNVRQLQTQQQALSQAQQTLQRTQHKRQDIERAIANTEQQLVQQRQQWEQAAQQRAGLEGQKLALTQCVELINKRLNESKLLRQCSEKQQAMQACNNDYNAAKQTSLSAARYADELELKWHQNQAAILAARLQPNQACPVCGSHEHPHPAQSNSDTVTKEQVQSARQQQSRGHQQELSAATAYQQASADLHFVQQQLSELQEDLAQQASLDELQQQRQDLQSTIQEREAINLERFAEQIRQTEHRLTQHKQQAEQLHDETDKAQQYYTQLETEVNRLQASLHPDWNTLDKVLARKQSVEQQMKALTTQLQNAEQRLNQARSAAAAANAFAESAAKQLEQWQQSLETMHEAWLRALQQSPFTDEAAYQQARLSHDTRTALNQDVHAFDEQLARLTGQLESLQAQLAEHTIPDIVPLEATLEACQTEVTSAFNQVTELASRMDNLRQVKAKLVDLYARNQALEAKYQVYGTLSDIANGRTGAKVSLHRFVLGVLLDDVLIQASQRLQIMSRGRYLLKRKQERAKGNAGSGLDLMVEDGYTGKWRDVATLSGGESFMAALSLALGVSDVVQSYSGGVRLDTLFIDEGFGSLDPESLDLAIQTLVDLQQGGRTIGIISHVSELKEQIALRLDIQASRLGSHIQLVS